MTPGERVAAAAVAALAGGPMGNTVRGGDYEAFLERTFGNGRALRSVRTSCAVFAGACLQAAGIQPRRGWPTARAITTWVGAGFGSASWVPTDRLVPQVGDIFYVCGHAAPTWHAATNGHVGILIEGADWAWLTAEGGGGTDGTLCRLGAAPKDLRAMSRTLRGVWRPALMLPPEAVADTEPSGLAPPPLHLGCRGHDVAEVQRIVGVQPDGVWGPITDAAVRRYRVGHGLPDVGVWDEAARNTRI